MRCEIVAELATGHGGDIELAKDMIATITEAGADAVKLQAYDLEKLNPSDPQASWLRQAHLSLDQIQALVEYARVPVIVTPFCADTLCALREHTEVNQFKIASSEAARGWWKSAAGALTGERWIVSYPWGYYTGNAIPGVTALTAIPLYPTPLACVGRAKLLDGWSDHTASLDASMYAIARGVKMVEVHVTLPVTAARCMAWDKSPDDVALLRGFADNVATMTSGVPQTFIDRWNR